MVEKQAEILNCLLKSFNAVVWTSWKNAADPTAQRTLDRLVAPTTELMKYAVAHVLDEMRRQPHDPQVQAMGIRMLQSMIQESEPLKQIAFSAGSVDVLVQGVRQHPTDENLLAAALETIENLQGVASLMQAMESLKENRPAVRAAFWAFSSCAKSKWSDVEKLCPRQLMRVVLSAAETHKDDIRVLTDGLELIGNLNLELTGLRGAFAELGGWQWLLQVMETHHADSTIQQHSCRALSALAKGGAFAEAYMARTMAALERALCEHEEDDHVLYWAFWAIQELNGAQALVQPMRRGHFKTPSAMLEALRSLNAAAWGQSEATGVEQMPAIVDAVVHAMETFPDRTDILCEASSVLGRVGAFEVSAASGADPGRRHVLLSSVQAAVNALVQLLKVRIADVYTVIASCEALAGIAEACSSDSPVNAAISSCLFGQDDQLLSRATALHVSHDQLQANIMFLSGILSGATSIVKEMKQHPSSHAIQMSGIKALSALFGDRIDLEPRDVDCVPEAIQIVCAAMSMFRENMVLQQHACYALCTMVEHCSDASNQGSQDCFMRCLVAAVEALRLVRGRCDSRSDPASYNALYLRKESTRCIGAVCAIRPSLAKWIRDNGLQDLLADALKSTADSVWEGQRDADVEETLRLELLALSYVLGPPTAILEALRRWGGNKPAVVRAVADAVVELARTASSRSYVAEGAMLGASDPAAVAMSAPLQALHAAGCGTELIAAMKVHASDEDLQGRIHLAVGFMNNDAVRAI